MIFVSLNLTRFNIFDFEVTLISCSTSLIMDSKRARARASVHPYILSNKSLRFGFHIKVVYYWWDQNGGQIKTSNHLLVLKMRIFD